MKRRDGLTIVYATGRERYVPPIQLALWTLFLIGTTATVQCVFLSPIVTVLWVGVILIWSL